jgi:enoyl-CoA hydratase/carnithine racemase
MTCAELLCTRDGAVATITLNRPRSGTRSRCRCSRRFTRRAGGRRDADVRVLILRGAGKAFCAGLDLKEMGLARRADGSVEYPEIEGALHELERCPVPTIAMMQGDAIAGGLELALHCDLRVAATSARMGMPLARSGSSCRFR